MINNNRHYQYNCTCPIDLEELNYIVDNNTDITYNTFLKNVNTEDFQSLKTNLGYTKNFSIKNDWHVTYHKTTYKGKRIYFMCHSRIEYVFY